MKEIDKSGSGAHDASETEVVEERYRRLSAGFERLAAAAEGELPLFDAAAELRSLEPAEDGGREP